MPLFRQILTVIVLCACVCALILQENYACAMTPAEAAQRAESEAILRQTFKLALAEQLAASEAETALAQRVAAILKSENDGPQTYERIFSIACAPVAATENLSIGLTFKTQSVRNMRELTRTTLRLYRRRAPDSSPGVLIVLIFEESGMGASAGHSKLAEMHISRHYTGWLSFDITSTMRRWLRESRKRKTSLPRALLVRVIDGQNGRLVDPLLIGGIAIEQQQAFAPFIAGYYVALDEEQEQQQQRARHKRNIAQPKYKATDTLERSDYFEAQLISKANPDYVRAYNRIVPGCRREPFTMDFRETYLDQTIINPMRFEAYYCTGSCVFPLGSPNEHTLIQAYLSFRDPKIPPPKCVPTRYKDIAAVVYLRNETRELTLRNAVIQECGCA